MQKFNLIAQSVLELSHREKGTRRQRLRLRLRLRRHQPGLNYSPRRNVFRRGQKTALKLAKIVLLIKLAKIILLIAQTVLTFMLKLY